MARCIAVLKSGDRRGQLCNRDVFVNGTSSQYCKRHHRQTNLQDLLNNKILCTYDPPLSQYNNAMQSDESEEELLSYINLRIGPPLFLKPMTICFISNKKPEKQHFTKYTLAHEIFDEFEWMLKFGTGINPIYSIDNIRLKSIELNEQLNVHVLNYSII